METLHDEEGHPGLHQHHRLEVLVVGQHVELGVNMTPDVQIWERPKKSQLHDGILAVGGILPTEGHDGGWLPLQEVTGGNLVDMVAVVVDGVTDGHGGNSAWEPGSSSYLGTWGRPCLGTWQQLCLGT